MYLYFLSFWVLNGTQNNSGAEAQMPAAIKKRSGKRYVQSSARKDSLALPSLKESSTVAFEMLLMDGFLFSITCLCLKADCTLRQQKPALPASEFCSFWTPFIVGRMFWTMSATWSWAPDNDWWSLHPVGLRLISDWYVWGKSPVASPFF